MRLKGYLTFRGRQVTQLFCVTDDISRWGIQMHCKIEERSNELPAVGKYVEIDLELPALGSDRLPRRSLYCQGTIAWSRAMEGDGLHLGVEVHRMHFRNLPRYFFASVGKGAETGVPGTTVM